MCCSLVSYVAKKYCLSALEKACDKFMSNNLTADNVLLVLQQALLFDSDFISLCWHKVDEWTKDVISSDAFNQIDHQVLVLLLQRDSLSVDEVDLFRATVRWARHECQRRGLDETAVNIRHVLGQALYLIRFPSVSGDDFAFAMDSEVSSRRCWN